MPEYGFFQGFGWAIRKRLKRNGVQVTPEIFEKIMLEQIAVEFAITETIGSDSVEMPHNAIQIYEECCHFFLSHQVIYCSPEFVNRILQTNLKVLLDRLYIPHHVFELCFPKGFKLPSGEKLEAALVMVAPHQELQNAIDRITKRMDTIAKGVWEKMGYPRRDYSAQGWFKEVQLTDKVDLSIHALSPFENAFLHERVPTDASRSIEEVIRGMRDSVEYNHLTGRVLSLSANEKLFMQKVCKIALGVVCYQNTKDPDIQPFKNQNRFKAGAVRPSEILVGNNMEAQAHRGWHLRSSHMRFLRDKRYRRDEGGKVRVIWVREHEVNRNKKASVPEAKKTKAEEYNHKREFDSQG